MALNPIQGLEDVIPPTISRYATGINRKMVWKYRPYLLIPFFREFGIPNIWGGCTENTSQKWKMVGSFCEEFLTENDFEVVLVNFCCYDWYQCFSGSSED